MWYRSMGIGLVLLLASCASKQSGPDKDGPQAFESQREEIKDVGLDAPPPSQIAQESRKTLIDPYKEERSKVENALRLQNEDSLEGAAPKKKKKKKRKGPAPTLVKQYDGPVAPMAGRVGIMNLVGNQLSHVHSSTFGGHKRDYNVPFNFSGFIMQSLREALLSKTPYQPIPIPSTGMLRQSSDSWQESWDGKAFAPQFQREFDGIIKQNRLAMLIVVSNHRMKDGLFIGGTTLSGTGLYTRGGTFGQPKSAVFATFQFYRLVGTPAQLVEPVMAPTDRSIGDLPGIELPEELENLPSRYLAPIYKPLRDIVRNKVDGLIALPRKIGN